MNSFLIPIVAIIFGCLIAIFAVIFSYLEKKKYLDTVCKCIEAGKNPEEIKPLLEAKGKIFEGKNGEKDPFKYMKNGIIVLAIGIGVFIWGIIGKTNTLTGIGIFILLLGLAFLVIYFLTKNKALN